ncbi:MFS transporter [Sulfolobales archaeon HS-7]|nr:MFS transporter [Sulfolobales archaeon HS-7]
MSSNNTAMKTLLILSLMLILINYVETMVVPALPKIQQDFATTATTVGWVTSAYLIVGAIASPIFGKLADRYGKKKMYVTAVMFYIIAVGLAGISPSIGFLIGARAIQGLGYAVFPIAIAIITDVFPKERVAFAQGILSGTLAIGPALGLLIGSYVVQDLGWPYAFHTAFILSLIIFVISLKYLEETNVRTMERVDYQGALLIGISMASVLIYLTDGPSYGWVTLQQLSLLVIFAITLAIFIRLEQRKVEPLMKLSLFKIRNVMVANVAGIISGISMFLMFIAITYYSQLPRPFGLGLSIIQAGLLMSPVAIVMAVIGPFVGRMVSKIGPKLPLIVGSGIGMIGFSTFIFNRSTPTAIVEDTILSAAGLIFIIVPLVNMIAVSLPPESRGVGIGMNTLIRTLGSSIGPVISTTLMDTFQTSYVMLFNNQIIPVGDFPSSTAFDIIFAIGTFSMLLTLIISLWTKNYRAEVKGETVAIGG